MKKDILTVIAIVMFIARAGVCAGSFISAVLLGLMFDFGNAIFAFILAVVICPVWDDYQ